MPISDFWMQAILSSNPSPVPSTTSSNDENHLDMGCSQTPLLNMPMLWNPALVLAIYQLQQQQQQQQQLLGDLKYGINKQPEPIKEPPSVSRKRVAEASHPRKLKLRRIGEDTVTNSPVSGMFIKEESDVKPLEELQKEADFLDETAAYVEVTEESRMKIEQIPNYIGDCVCRLCKVKYEDVFKLAQHKCPRIAHEEYKCPDCEKVFSCPANLASHRRWHKPRTVSPTAANNNHTSLACATCFSMFPTKKMLKNHMSSCQRSPLQSLLARVIPTV
ncbi:unnamed protein product [Caenorhabditis bovis]|uniref:C2H2-type domain-containing protein n=1 Tax=Caenorhabditis bovis TaxID=2654633 RepID=A0A8S1E5D9_9PELO|nr:unnamed protein product [Caenorhabditis bovis]